MAQTRADAAADGKGARTRSGAARRANFTLGGRAVGRSTFALSNQRPATPARSWRLEMSLFLKPNVF